jgi:hypothetical protein
MTTVHRFRVATVLTVAGFAITFFWLIELYVFFTHHRPTRGAGVEFPHPFLLLGSAAIAVFACVGALGLAVPTLVRDPAQRTPARIASSIGAALTALPLVILWASVLSGTPGLLNFVVFFGLAPGVPVLLIARAARRFRAESSEQRPIVVLAIALLVLWAVASYVALTANYVALSMAPLAERRVSYLATFSYAVFGSGLVIVMGRPRTRGGWALLIVAGVLFSAAVLVGTGVPRDPARAVTLSQIACDRGELYACTTLGLAYEHGSGIPLDLARAAALFQKACDGGEPRACTNLGLAYHEGSGVPLDLVRAATLSQKACDGGDVWGCRNIALAYVHGSGVLVDLARAAALYQKACDGGELQACTNLGTASEHGSGVPRDPARAAALFRKACDGEEALGCRNLGVAYAHGIGVPRDLVRATALYQKACDGGEPQACALLIEAKRP